jgi:creatinine amidohydrolase/Fe(II)-dependent formamide hydrolase-like protein
MILVCFTFMFSPSCIEQFTRKNDFHAGKVETSKMLHLHPELVRQDRVKLDKPAIARMLRDDPDSYQARTCYSRSPFEVPNTTQDERVKIGVMGYPHEASAEFGEKMLKEIVKNAGRELKKALKQAEQCRKTGKMFKLKDTEKMKILG